MEFQEQTIKVIIDDSKCAACETKACIAACKTFARGILVLKEGKPVVEGDPKRLGTECLACEYECWMRGKSAIKIEAPIPDLEAYRKKHGIS
jgi:hypothetical protein